MNEKEVYLSKEKIEKVVPKNDRVFKKIFGSVGSEEILRDFLESILEIKIKKVKLGLATELPSDNYYGKDSRLDVRADLEDRNKSKCRSTIKHVRIQ